MDYKKFKYISYDNDGRAKYHSLFFLAILRAKYYKTFVDIIMDGGKSVRSLRDYRGVCFE